MAKVIVAVDGEGYWDTDRQTHIYDELRVGTRMIGAPGYRVGFQQALDLIWDTHDWYTKLGHTPYFMGYFLNYDFSQWMRTLDDWAITKLANRSERQYTVTGRDPKPGSWQEERAEYYGDRTETYFVTLDWGDRFSPRRYEVDWVQHKSMTVKRPKPESIAKARANNDERLIEWDRLTIYDPGSIFASGFLKTAESWLKNDLSQNDRDVIQRGKASRAINCTRATREKGRGVFGDDDFIPSYAEVAEYNLRENILLERVMVKFHETISGHFADMAPTYDGPGYIAAHVLEGMARETATPDPDTGLMDRGQVRATSALLEADQVAATLGVDAYGWVNSAYFGGWFEVFDFGYVGQCYEYDINSAYPAVIRDLPSLAGAVSEWTDNYADCAAAFENGDLVWADVSVFGTQDKVGPAMYRGADGSVTRPRNSRSICEWGELQMAYAAGLVSRIDVHKALIIRLDHSQPKPLSRVDEMYQQRLAVGKNQPPGLALKIVLNSLYGKMAQAVGTPRYANPVYAALITARCRTMILHAIATHPRGLSDLVAVATDAVFFRTPHKSIHIDPTQLGAWDELQFIDSFFLKPGVYGVAENGRDSHGNYLPMTPGVRGGYTLGNAPHFDTRTKGFSKASFESVMVSQILPLLDTMHAAQKWDNSASVSMHDSFSMVSIPLAVARGALPTAGEFMSGTHGLPDSIKAVSFETMPKRRDPIYSAPHGCFTTLAPRPVVSPHTYQLSPSVYKGELIGGLRIAYPEAVNVRRYDL